MSAPCLPLARLPHWPGGLSSASEVGLTTAIKNTLLRVRPIAEFVDFLEHTEEIRLLDDQCGHVLTPYRRSDRISVVPRGDRNPRAPELMFWFPRSPAQLCGSVGLRLAVRGPAREFDLRFARTAMRQASAARTRRRTSRR